MNSIKHKIKRILPDRWLYYYSIIKLLPKYLLSIKSKSNNKFDIAFYDDVTTVDLIVNDNKSLSRFGDGEFLWMIGEHLDSFQQFSKELSIDLINAFKSDNDNLLIGIPYGLFNSDKCNMYAKMHWSIIRANTLNKISEFLELNKTYSNASITRPYIDYNDYEYSSDCFKNLKRIWANRDVIFIEGEKTKLGMGNDLFENANSIKRIICPACNAYEKKNEIISSVLKNASTDTMLLGALGPTSSILAAELVNRGYQFIDIGHIDIEYMWFKNHSILRDKIDGKFVNESGTKECTNIYDLDEKYLNSIIDRIL